MVLVVKRQTAAHHLIHDDTQAPPVHRPAVVVIFQDLTDRPISAVYFHSFQAAAEI